jgi:hypothetical protein
MAIPGTIAERRSIMRHLVVLAIAAGVLLPSGLDGQSGKDRQQQQSKASGSSSVTQLTASFRPCDAASTCAHMVALEWQPVQRSTQYWVYRSLAEGGPFEQVTKDLAYFGYASPPPTTRISDVSSLRPATRYYYRVGLMMDNGQERFSNVVLVQTPETRPPRDLTASAKGLIVELAWRPGFGAVGYRVCRAEAPDGPFTDQGWKEPAPLVVEWFDLKLEFDVSRTYYYRVLAISEARADTAEGCAGDPFAATSVRVPGT